MDEQPTAYCMTRVTFGNTSSPFLSIANVQKHLEDHKDLYSTAAEGIKDNMYVDDVLSGSPSDEEALQLKKDMTKLMKAGDFELTKWASNSAYVMENIPPSEIDPNLVITSKTSDPEKWSNLLKALGVSWHTLKNVFLFLNGAQILERADPLTKRSLISLYASVFDPMGLVALFLMRPTLLFQEFWARATDWDDPLDDDDVAQA